MSRLQPDKPRLFIATSSTNYQTVKGSPKQKQELLENAIELFQKDNLTLPILINKILKNPQTDNLFLLNKSSWFSCFGPQISKGAQKLLAYAFIKEQGMSVFQANGQFNFSKFKKNLKQRGYEQISQELKPSYFRNIKKISENKGEKIQLANKNSGYYFSSSVLGFVEMNPAAIYTGEHKDGKAHGFGTLQWPCGCTYVGQFTNGKQNRHGALKSPSGRIFYIGQFKDNKRHGFGTYTSSDGHIYFGGFKNNTLHGFGTYILPNGDTYVGQWKENRRDGFGTYSWWIGNHYRGQWKNDKRHGFGSYYYPKFGISGFKQWEEGRAKGGDLTARYANHDELTQIITETNLASIQASDKCKEANKEIKESYLKVYGKIYQPYLDETNKLPSALNEIIAEYAAPNWVGDGEKWDLEKGLVSKFFARLLSALNLTSK